ncbi:MAG: hypothetical protein AAFX10_16135, partial [Pseudomonadota bacterium]
MKRRDFVRMTATASGMLLCGGTRLALGQQSGGPYWLFIEARGGWDPTSFCDPKGGAVGSFPSDPGETNTYDASDIGQAGNLRYAPKPALWDAPAAQTPEPSLDF